MLPNPALEQFLRSIPLFQLLAPEDMPELLRLLRPVTLEAGEVLFREGEPGNAMWVLGEGTEVAISRRPEGAARPEVVARLGSGETVGELALLDEQGRSGTAVVTQPGPAHQIYALDFQALRDAYHPAAFRMIRRICLDLCGRLRRSRPVSLARVLQAPVGEAPAWTPLSSAAALEAFPAFGPLPEVVKLALAQKLCLFEAEARTPLFAERDLADGAYFVLAGSVTLTRGGVEIASTGAGSMVGLVAVLDRGTRSAAAIAEPGARLLRLSDADFDALFARGNRFAFQLVDHVARQLARDLRSANALGRPSAEAMPTLDVEAEL